MSRKKEVLEMVDRDCINPLTKEVIKDYICNLAFTNRQMSEKLENIRSNRRKKEFENKYCYQKL